MIQFVMVYPIVVMEKSSQSHCMAKSTMSVWETNFYIIRTDFQYSFPVTYTKLFSSPTDSCKACHLWVLGHPVVYDSNGEQVVADLLHNAHQLDIQK